MGSKTRYPAREQAREAVAKAEKAVELLERAFELMSEDDPIQPAVKQLYAVLCEAEDRLAVLEDWYIRTYGQEAEQWPASTTIEESGQPRERRSSGSEQRE